ncbi:plasmid mobilization relaxosome protein MobC, partial [Salmonella enterica subsp. houtenae serovar 48:z4,z32:-]|nr:plasmid mobilization relaxosome protein MobC [Salmonella enterica subsp. houtenae serovar 48:z4,z32:-]HAE3207294.1 plasmid mobilization relaxosome protein MobC [Salmonella enterica subsp. houtenae serovar 48:z4,z32:-]
SLYREIQHQGNNINQIAKRLNANEDFKQSVAAEANFAIKQLRKRILRACEVYAV